MDPSMQYAHGQLCDLREALLQLKGTVSAQLELSNPQITGVDIFLLVSKQITGTNILLDQFQLTPSVLSETGSPAKFYDSH